MRRGVNELLLRHVHQDENQRPRIHLSCWKWNRFIEQDRIEQDTNAVRLLYPHYFHQSSDDCGIDAARKLSRATNFTLTTIDWGCLIRVGFWTIITIRIGAQIVYLDSVITCKRAEDDTCQIVWWQRSSQEGDRLCFMACTRMQTRAPGGGN